MSKNKKGILSYCRGKRISEKLPTKAKQRHKQIHGHCSLTSTTKFPFYSKAFNCVSESNYRVRRISFSVRDSKTKHKAAQSLGFVFVTSLHDSFIV